MSRRVREELVVPGRQRLGLVEDDTVVDGYVRRDRVGDLVGRYRLRQDTKGPITLRSTSMEIDYVQRLAVRSGTLAAVDAATSLEPRERGVGEQELVRRLESFREHQETGRTRVPPARTAPGSSG